MDFSIPVACPTCGHHNPLSVQKLFKVNSIQCPCGQLLCFDQFSPGFHQKVEEFCEALEHLDESLKRIVARAKSHEMGPCFVCQNAKLLPDFAGMPMAAVCDTCPEHQKAV